MMAPLPTPPPPDRPDRPRVRLEVRTGSGRAVTYEVGADEFLIGEAAGCDLRIPTPTHAAVVCQLARKPDGVRVRRIAPGLPVLLNETPLPVNVPTPVAHADRLSVAGVEVVVGIQAPGYIAPKLVAFADTVSASGGRLPPVSDHPHQGAGAPRSPEPDRAEWDRRDADLVRRQRELDQQAEELAADRALWYQKRLEYEREMASGRSLALRGADLTAREQEVARQRDELVAYRDQLVGQHETAQAQLSRSQGLIREAHARQTEDRAAFEAERAAWEPKRAELRDEQARVAAAAGDLARQRELFAADQEYLNKAKAAAEAEADRLAGWEQELSARETTFRTDREAFDRDRETLTADLLRLDRRRDEADARDRELTARAKETDARLEQLRKDAAEWEATVQVAAAEQERLRAEADRLDRQKADLDAQTARLAERAAQLDAQQGVLGVLRAKLDRTRADAEREAAALGAARVREEESQEELRRRIREAEQLRAELSTVQESTEQERRRLEERDSLLSAGLEEIRVQKEALAAAEARVSEREAALDGRSAEFAEQAGALKGRMGQALDLQARLEADRVAIREREAALNQAEAARQALQEQLRKRAEELTAKAKVVDEWTRRHAAEKAAVEAAAAVANEKAAEAARQAEVVAGREAAVARQVTRLQEVGRAVAADRKTLAEAKAAWAGERSAAEERLRSVRDELEALRQRATAEFAGLRAEAPALDDHATSAQARVAAARDALKAHLAELHDFARRTREDLDAARNQLRAEADRLAEREAALDRAKAEHRLAVTALRQQLVDWQATVAELRRGLSQGEARLADRQAAVDEAARRADATTRELAEQAEALRREREAVAARRAEVERHLADMREWYRRKLRELAAGNAQSGTRNAEPTGPRLATIDADVPDQGPRTKDQGPGDEVEPMDRQLGELLRSLELVEADTLAALWAEAGRQRRTLRQVLLASGAVTLYQLALIEAGNLDGLVLGRFRVIDRLRATPREAIYRVFDPARGRVFQLRHLAEAELHDAVRPDEFRQRWAAARDAAHPNLAAVVEVLDLGGRPAAVLEWPAGLFAPDWPTQAGHPGCWARLAVMAADGLDAGHRAGLAHGRLTSDSFLLTADGTLKLVGFGEPPWLGAGPVPVDPSPAADLRALGQVLYGWSQLAARPGAKPRGKKGFPAELAEVVRRLGADADSPMGDTVGADRPYASAADVAVDLRRLARGLPSGDDAWAELLRQVAEATADGPAALRQSA
ncbi:MAG: hypothetical protein K2X87_32785 [Gemmataceae bacterium]|nr:hypothetical protein [Gemmataceae bacterium]